MVNKIKSFISKLFLKKNKKIIKELEAQVNEINKLLANPKTLHWFFHELSEEDFSSDNLHRLFLYYNNVINEFNIKIIKCFEKEVSSSILVQWPFLSKNLTFINVIGDDKLQIFDKICISKNSNLTMNIDYTILLDSNIVSDLEKYFTTKNISPKFIADSKLIINQKCNFDLLPYSLENIINLCIKRGSSIKLNRQDRQQEGFFQNLDILYKELTTLPLPNLDKFIDLTNKNIPLIYKIFNNCRLFLIFLLQSRELFPKKDKKQISHIKKREKYVLSKIDEKSLLFSTRMVKIMKIFFEKDNHIFFSKVRNFNNKEDYIYNLNNTAIDLFICMMPQIFYNNNGIFPILYTQDNGLKIMFNDLKPDLIICYDENGKNVAKYLYKGMEKTLDDDLISKLFSSENKKRRDRVSQNTTITHNSQVKKEIDKLFFLLKKEINIKEY